MDSRYLSLTIEANLTLRLNSNGCTRQFESRATMTLGMKQKLRSFEGSARNFEYQALFALEIFARQGGGVLRTVQARVPAAHTSPQKKERVAWHFSHFTPHIKRIWSGRNVCRCARSGRASNLPPWKRVPTSCSAMLARHDDRCVETLEAAVERSSGEDALEWGT